MFPGVPDPTLGIGESVYPPSFWPGMVNFIAQSPDFMKEDTANF
jgi:hypothetical protein